MRRQRNLARIPVRGFSLVELAVVMTIVALLLGGLIYTLAAQTEQRNFEETRRRLEIARELVLSYAIVKGRLPCPARYTSSASHSQGFESFCTTAATSSVSTCVGSETTTEPSPINHGTCSNHFDGYLPAATIGFTQVDANGFAVDVWGNRIRYAVSRKNVSCGTSPPNTYTTIFTSKSYLQTYGVACQPDDIEICRSATGITGAGTAAASCGSAANRIMTTSLVVALVFSTGKNANSSTGADEAANLNVDWVYVYHEPRSIDATTGEFDDQFTWIPVGEFYGRLISAGVLP